MGSRPPDGDAGWISVCMATHNGAAYVRDQLLSILDQLGPDDEVIVADDASTDGTRAIVTSLDDRRVTLLEAPHNVGHVRTFARAIAAATGEVIFLADQDDLWPPGRILPMTRGLDHRPVVAGNVTLFGTRTGRPRRRLRARESGRGARNLLRIFAGTVPYFGSAMAFRAEVRTILLPIPPYVESHDVWLAMVGNLTGGLEHCEEIVLERRLHGDNVSAPRRRPVATLVVVRVAMLRAVMEILRRRARQRRTGR